MKPKFATEADMARIVVEWLNEQQWEVYQEVNTGQCCPTCDIVARRGPVTWAIECKLGLNLEVIAQACHWRHRANYSSVAVPWKYHSNAAEGMLSELGLGILRVKPPAPEDAHIQGMRIACTMGTMRRPKVDIRKYLYEEQKTWAEAGTNKGGRFSPFQATCRSIRDAVVAAPGITLRDLMRGIKHHYSSDTSARGCIAKWAEAGAIEGVKLARSGRVLQLFPTEVQS